MLAILSFTLYLNITFYSLLRMLYFILLINPGKLLYHHANWCLGTLHCSYKYEESNMNMLNYGEDFINNIWICAIHHIPQRLVPLFVPIGVCVTTHDDGTASDVTIGMWRNNQQATNHERNDKPWFSFPK